MPWLGRTERMENLLSQDDLNSLLGDISFEPPKEVAPPETKQETSSDNESLSQDEIDRLLEEFQK